ncbi:MAG: Ubiquinone biosynthesis O-methyltransferase [Candidatus Methanogaster sp.]|nr:MAG: Ubiquinone biosynthesis O-methyltransferase [ANME-2 cluster archaeon]
MPKRIESHEEAISGIDDVRQYVETAKNSGNIMYGSFLDHIKSLGVGGGRYLEIGAGTGTLAAMIAEDNPDVHITAVEISNDMVTVAREYIEERKLNDRIRFVALDAADGVMMGELGEFDLVYSTLSMHHWKDPEKVIGNLLKAVGAGGVLFIHDLRRVWWLYYLPFRSSGFIGSIRAAYMPDEIKTIFQRVGTDRYEIKRRFPYFMHSIIVRK